MGNLASFSPALIENVMRQPFALIGRRESATKRTERLPFTIRFVQDEEDLRKAVSMRHAAYARHVPTLAERLVEPEPIDYDNDVRILLAESNLDGRVLGTMRVHTNKARPLPLESSVCLPEKFQGRILGEASRLAVAQERIGRVVKTLLFKAFYMHCLSTGIDWMVITARSPLDRHYESLLFENVFPDRGFIPMNHVGNIPHRVFAHEIGTAGERWAEAEHPLYDLYFHTYHPDIKVVEREKELPLYLQDFLDLQRELRMRASLSS